MVAKQVDHLISPMLFETLRFKAEYSSSSLKKYTSISEYIDLGKELVFSRCAKNICIDILDAYPYQHLPWLRLLNRLVPTLVNLQSVQCVPFYLYLILALTTLDGPTGPANIQSCPWFLMHSTPSDPSQASEGWYFGLSSLHLFPVSLSHCSPICLPSQSNGSTRQMSIKI